MIKLSIDDLPVEVPNGTTVLAAARKVNIHIPNLCAHQELNHFPGACRVCLVECDRSRSLVASCVFPVAEGIKIRTNTERVRKTRRTVVEFLLSDHPDDCQLCQKNGSCELQETQSAMIVFNVFLPHPATCTQSI